MTTVTFGNGTPAAVRFGNGTPALGWTPPAPVITTTGATFHPEIELAAGSSATVTWTDNAGTVLATGLAPTISFGSAATRSVQLHCTDYGAITSLNLGFNAGQDAGREGPGGAYDKAAEAVTGITGLPSLTGLQQFMAAATALTGLLDFTGLSELRYVECFSAEVTGVILTGCTSLIRLCLENCHVSYLDLNPVAGNLKDLRAAIQWDSDPAHSLTFATLTSRMERLWHYCVRDQQVVNIIPHAQLPVIEQHWIWNSGQTTSDAPISTVLGSLYNELNTYDQATVNAILVAINTTSTVSGGDIKLTGSAAPSGAGATAKAALQARGWSVLTA